MKRELIETLVLDQRQGIERKEKGLARDVDFYKLIFTKQITVISGIRRCGKSTLLLQLMEEFDEFSYMNFDDERLLNFSVSDFQTLLSIFSKFTKSEVVFFDEIQNVEGWERFIRRIFDEGYKIFITGSNAKLLSSELATHLTGRYIKIELFPFSFSELLSYHNVNYNKLSSSIRSEIIVLFDYYLIEGGFPEMIKYNDDEFLMRVYEDVLYKGLIVRYKIKNIKQFKNLSQYLFTNFTSSISYNSLKTLLNIKSATTVQEYISFLEESYLIFELYKYDFSLKKQFVSNKKVFIIDNGIRNKVALMFSSDKGRFLENLVFIELKRREKDFYFYKTKRNLEIDFLYYDNKQFHLIQVSYGLGDMRTRQREIKAMVDAASELPNTKNLLLTYDEEDTFVDGSVKIKIQPVWKWLLEIDSSR
jgi:predicted AAA+ superfamily ATPase